MTIQIKTRKKINTIKVTVDAFRLAAAFCLLCCATALACMIICWSYTGFTWPILTAVVLAALAATLTVALLVVYSDVERFNDIYGNKGGDDE